jgi:hypothetical protein
VSLLVQAGIPAITSPYNTLTFTLIGSPFITSSTDVDRFRIKIWDKDNDDAVVYDNQMVDADDSDASTEVERGNIVIHKK